MERYLGCGGLDQQEPSWDEAFSDGVDRESEPFQRERTEQRRPFVFSERHNRDDSLVADGDLDVAKLHLHKRSISEFEDAAVQRFDA